jgi:hypothetical protein
LKEDRELKCRQPPKCSVCQAHIDWSKAAVQFGDVFWPEWWLKKRLSWLDQPSIQTKTAMRASVLLGKLVRSMGSSARQANKLEAIEFA